MNSVKEVKVDQCWEDMDRRRKGRSFKVLDVTGDFAKVDDGKRKTLIRLDRFKNKYYRLRKTQAQIKTTTGLPFGKVHQISGKPDGFVQKVAPIVTPSRTIAKLPVVAVKPSPLHALSQLCNKVIKANWGGFGSHTYFENDKIKVIVRSIKKDCYDVKVRLDDHLVYSKVLRAELEDTLGQVKVFLSMLKSNIEDVLK